MVAYQIIFAWRSSGMVADGNIFAYVLHGNLMSIKLFVALLFFIFLPIQKYNKHRSRLIVVFSKRKKHSLA